MSDFDFDELDKAVAGVTNTSADQTFSALEEASQPDASAIVIAPTPAPEVNASLASTPVSQGLPAARRSSGRFMDVVHPSSDMRTRTSPAVVNAPSTKSETSSFVPPVTNQPVEVPSEVPDEAPYEELEQVIEEAPKDTMDFEENGASMGEWSKPLETPFLADAKVEKRPLGGVGPEPSLILLDEPEEELLIEAPDEPRIEANALPDPIDFAAHLATLDSEKEDTGEQTIEQLDELVEPEPVIPPALEVHTSPAPVESTGPTSITQQYTEQPVSQQESGAIFDTENYHQPLAPVAKKHSSALTIIGIILLVILGAGAGVAFYMFVLPML